MWIRVLANTVMFVFKISGLLPFNFDWSARKIIRITPVFNYCIATGLFVFSMYSATQFNIHSLDTIAKVFNYLINIVGFNVFRVIVFVNVTVLQKEFYSSARELLQIARSIDRQFYNFQYGRKLMVKFCCILLVFELPALFFTLSTCLIKDRRRYDHKCLLFLNRWYKMLDQILMVSILLLLTYLFHSLNNKIGVTMSYVRPMKKLAMSEVPLEKGVVWSMALADRLIRVTNSFQNLFMLSVFLKFCFAYAKIIDQVMDDINIINYNYMVNGVTITKTL
jgi:hypothetical protein